MASTASFAKTNDFGDNFVRTQHLFYPPNDPHENITHANVDNLRRSGIHDIWRYKAFRDCSFKSAIKGRRSGHKDYERPDRDLPVDVYLRMRPALRLATRLLRRARYALMRIAFAPVSQDRLYFTNRYETTLRMEDNFDDLLQALSFQIRFFHYPFSCNPAYGWSTLQAGPENSPNTHAPIGFPIETYLAFARPDWDHLPFSQRDSISLMFAAIMIHELAHIINNRRFRSTYPLSSRLTPGFKAAEPALWRDDKACELGDAVERYLWGGRLGFPSEIVPGTNNANNRMPAFDGRLGLTIAPYYAYEGNRRPITTYASNYNGHPWFIHPKSLIQFFDTSTFEQHPNAPRNTRGRIMGSTIILSLGGQPVSTAATTGVPGLRPLPMEEAMRADALRVSEAESNEGDVGYAFNQLWWRRRNGFMFGTGEMNRVIL